MVAGALIWWQPTWQWADPLIAFIFAVLVVLTTAYLLKDVYSILMESTPRNIDSTALFQDLRSIEGVIGVSCLHVWQLAPGKICMTGKILVETLEETDDVLRDALNYCKYKYGLMHSTIQVSMDPNL